MHNIMMIAEEDLTRAKEKMTEWVKEKEKPAVKKEKTEEKKPKEAEPNFFEGGVEVRENALNVEDNDAPNMKKKKKSDGENSVTKRPAKMLQFTESWRQEEETSM